MLYLSEHGVYSFEKQNFVSPHDILEVARKEYCGNIFTAKKRDEHVQKITLYVCMCMTYVLYFSNKAQQTRLRLAVTDKQVC